MSVDDAFVGDKIRPHPSLSAFIAQVGQASKVAFLNGHRFRWAGKDGAPCNPPVEHAIGDSATGDSQASAHPPTLPLGRPAIDKFA